MSHFLRDRDSQELSQALQAAAEDLHRGQAAGPHLRVLLLEDRVTVIQGVETLRDVQRVAGDERQLQALGGLLHRLPRLRHLQDQVPEVHAPHLLGERGDLLGEDVGSDPLLLEAAADVLRPHQRVLEIGPDSPSKLSASSKSKAITRLLVALTMKKRRAAGAISWTSPSSSASPRSRLRLAISSRALSSRWSIRSSALTPSPLRPDISSTLSSPSASSRKPSWRAVAGERATIS